MASAHEALMTRFCKQAGCPLEAGKNGYCAGHGSRRAGKPDVDAEEPKLTLEGLIEQQIQLGHSDPHDFPALVRRAAADDLVALVKPYIDDFIAEMARHRLGALRRASIAKITTATVREAETLRRSLWVPTTDGKLLYKRIADMTADDFDVRAGYLDRMVRGIRVHAEWCRDCAKRMREEDAATAGKLSSLPPLPEVE